MIRSEMPRRVLCLAVCAIALGALPVHAQHTGGSAQPDTVHLRNACRLAAQVLERGQPANRHEWALSRIAGCGAEGGRALAASLARVRSATSRTQEMELLVGAALGFLDRSVYTTAVDIARDPSAGEVARVQAFRILLSQVRPSSPPTYEELAAGVPGEVMYDWHPTAGEPLPQDFRAEVAATGTSVLAQNPPAAVREAAYAVRIAARTAQRRK